jgi:hypothetical protein
MMEIGGDALRAIGRKLLHLGMFLFGGFLIPLRSTASQFGWAKIVALQDLVWFGTVDCGLRMGLSLNVCGALASGQLKNSHCIVNPCGLN